MKHLNEDILLKYTFDLLDEQQRTDAAAHLEQCADCRAKHGQIQGQFAALNVLDENETLSDDLIRKTLSQQTAVKTLPFYRKAWFEWTAAAAAVVLICAVLLQNLPRIRMKEPIRPGFDNREFAREDQPGPQPGQIAGDLSDRNEEGPTPTTESLALALNDNLLHEVKIVDTDAIPDKPPFAPASAIELVVLPKPDAMQLTIYNAEDLTLVRDTRKLTLKPGWNWLQFMWDGTLIDPTSLSLTPLEYADRIDIQQLVYPARLQHIGRWLIRSEVEGAVPFEITYFAAGLNWRAFYMGTMNADETKMDLKGYVNVANNSGQDFEDAQTRLIVGETRLIEKIPYLAGRRNPYGPDIVDDEGSLRYNWNEDNRAWWRNRGIAPTDYAFNLSDFDSGIGGFGGGGFGGALKYDVKQIEKEGLSEYFLYSIEGTEDLPNTWTRRLPSFDIDDIPVTSLYKYDEDRYGGQTVRFVSFANDDEHELGDTPIPEGSIKIYRNLNLQQNLSYIGQSAVKYIPVNEDVELNLGAARLVKVEPILMQTQTDNYTFDDKQNITGWDTIETWQLKLTNTREIPVDLEITRNFGTDTWDINVNALDDVDYKKHDKTRARFELTLPARSEQSFTYTVTRYQGTRSEAYTKQLQEQQ